MTGARTNDGSLEPYGALPRLDSHGRDGTHEGAGSRISQWCSRQEWLASRSRCSHYSWLACTTRHSLEPLARATVVRLALVKARFITLVLSDRAARSYDMGLARKMARMSTMALSLGSARSIASVLMPGVGSRYRGRYSRTRRLALWNGYSSFLWLAHCYVDLSRGLARSANLILTAESARSDASVLSTVIGSLGRLPAHPLALARTSHTALSRIGGSRACNGAPFVKARICIEVPSCDSARAGRAVLTDLLARSPSLILSVTKARFNGQVLAATVARTNGPMLAGQKARALASVLVGQKARSQGAGTHRYEDSH